MRIRRLIIALLICLLLLPAAACGQPAVETAPLQNSAPVPAQPTTPPVPTVQPPESPPHTLTATAPTPEPVPTPEPEPSLPPDEEAQLTYLREEEEVTLPAVLHHSPLGYAIAYDSSHFVCNTFFGGDVYWNSEGNYLSFNLIYDLILSEVLDGLRLQENIAMEPESVLIGRDQFPAWTLYLTAPNGLYRQFWVAELSDCLLLTELSYDTVSDEGPLLRTLQMAMLNTLYFY